MSKVKLTDFMLPFIYSNITNDVLSIVFIEYVTNDGDKH